MTQCNFYRTVHDLLEKTTCILVEKCYHSNFKIVVCVPNIEIQESLNRLLWTYSQKQFIPHGSKLDPLPNIQPVYITHEFENPNQATALVLVNPVEKRAIEILEPQTIENNVRFDRVFVVYNDYSEDYAKTLQQIIRNFSTNGYNIESYDQNSDGGWKKLQPVLC